MVNQRLAELLRRRFTDVGYLTDPVLEALGDDGQAGLSRNVTVPASSRLDPADPLSDVIALWLLQRPVPEDRLGRVLPVSDLVDAGIVERSGGEIRALVDVRPYGSPDDGASGWVMSDLLGSLDGRTAQPRPDYVLGISPASTTLAQMAIRRPVTSALDLGTGSGVQSMHLVRHADRVVATDLNPRALEHAAWTAALTGFDVDLRLGSLYEPVAGERFDLIVTNPPYVMSPPTGERLVYREGSFVADGLVRAVVSQAADHLTPGGTLQVLGNWAVTDSDWTERLTGWIPAGCDALIMERERLSTYEYIEMWLADAGLLGSDQWRPHYDEWLAYFDALGIRGVGMGWIEVQRHEEVPDAALRGSGDAAPRGSRDDALRASVRTPDIRAEQWPWAVEQPVGSAFAAAQVGRRHASLSDADLLAATWTLAADVVQESTGRPGEPDPAHVVLRQTSGFRRAMEVTTALGGVLGACDGELPLGVIIQAVASLLGSDEHDVMADVIPGVRDAIRYGMLTPTNRLDQLSAAGRIARRASSERVRWPERVKLPDGVTTAMLLAEDREER